MEVFGAVSGELGLFAAIEQTPAAQGLRERMEKGGLLSCQGVHHAAQPFFAVLLRSLFPDRPVVVVTDGVKAQESCQQDVDTWLGLRVKERESAGRGTSADGGGEASSLAQALFYPAWEIMPHETRLSHVDVLSERLETLLALCGAPVPGKARPPVVVTSVLALLQRSFPRSALRERLRVLRRGSQVSPLELLDWLEAQAYEPEARVTQKGEVAVRGGIVDVFPLTNPWPVRLEFCGDELESLRQFDPHTQVSCGEVNEVTLGPAGELGILRKMLRDAVALPAASNAKDLSAAAKSWQPEGQGELAPRPPELASLVEYLPRETIFVLCEPRQLRDSAAQYGQSIQPEDQPFHIGWDSFQEAARERGMTMISVKETESAVDSDLALPDESAGGSLLLDLPRRSSGRGELLLEGLDAYRLVTERAPEPAVADLQRRAFFGQLHRWARQGYGVHVFCNNEGERQRFAGIWAEYGLGQIAISGDGPPPRLRLGSLARGFICEEARVVVLTDAEVFGRYKVQRPRRLRRSRAAALRSVLDISFTDLEEGDYVVHLQHGIGRYLGLQRLPPAPTGRPGCASPTPGVGQECLVIEYAPRSPGQPAPKLYVPVTEAHLVSKYVGAGKARPALHPLGGTRWSKAKEQATAAVQTLAAELLRVQALRTSQPGFGFPPDQPWQGEFESAFIYEETPDQARAIAETKADLEQPRPMDRLICGDAGFGKTEVAVRAAFKAVLAGKQVAVLAPTTVLVQQHHRTFLERMADYPVRLESLSRFRTGREQRQVLQALASGAVDIVIGTHRLLQADVKFKELGLVVIDEEQRFGVRHKEMLKRLRPLVDVLTLSATPIPRTLYLSLVGARDMSTIETPPQDRLPVETIVAPYDERLIREVIQRELNRQGQVFFLHNRIEDIEQVASRLQALVPHARIQVGHGQMSSNDLEEVMARFVGGQTDVLLSTTIIESGIDIPNANTIIINRADRFGLSDLYQLRGRVGRYKHQAYAYLLLPRHARLLADARKRISAIRQFSTPGSGFKIAMRDLEIRGAGNLLGREQSGHITAVGFDLYCQLLRDSIAALKTAPLPPRNEVKIRFDFLTDDPAKETPPAARWRKRRKPARPSPEIVVPREVAVYVTDQEDTEGSAAAEEDAGVFQTAACLPESYIPEPQQRVEMHRKLGEATDAAALSRLRAELRDRFGPLPRAADLLLLVAELKQLAAARNLTVMETKADKLMLTRKGDYLMIDGRFPRLSRKSARARLQEIRRSLLSL
jgi:transcription-repair coupling factor (superfamily II helicase)